MPTFPQFLYAQPRFGLDLAHQEKADQRSLRFDQLQGQTVVELDRQLPYAPILTMSWTEHRAAATARSDSPHLQCASLFIQTLAEVDGSRWKISHQIRQEVMQRARKSRESGVIMESRPAVRLRSAQTDRERQAALLRRSDLIQSEPVCVDLYDVWANHRSEDSDAPSMARKSMRLLWTLAKASSFPAMRPSARSAPPAPAATVTDTSREALSAIQRIARHNRQIRQRDGRSG